ncbi:hypothetical protein TrLO_g9988 [Triparma laevis f. longispina]|uniref:Sister chromatid cohesion protein DCC1 n=1 Tax=Triparma laevis f. longispina TaxID=1714387 RepID=A0A9W7APS9_9STRA|nr:hypothetical protein TrLO_g9988 [Triparma laevis f. longispina]
MESNTLLKVLPSKSRSDNADNSLFLVEVPNTEFISQIGEARAEIIGKENSSKAALIAGKHSFYMTKVESSNAFIVVEPSSSESHDDEASSNENQNDSKRRKISKASICPSFHYELIQKYLDISELRRILDLGIYEGDAEECSSKTSKRHTKEELCVLLQASQFELDKGLKKVEAFVDESGKYTMVSEELLSEAFDEILAAISANDMNLESIDLENLLKSVTGDISTEKEVVAHCLHNNSTPLSSSDSLFKMDVAKIATFKAKKILSKRVTPYPVKEFMSQWTSEMPHQTTSYTPPMSLLSNLTLLDRDDKVDDDVLTYFPAGALPRDATSRFKRLFEIRPCWSEETITPFLTEISREDASVVQLLLKNALLKEKGFWIAKPQA